MTTEPKFAFEEDVSEEKPAEATGLLDFFKDVGIATAQPGSMDEAINWVEGVRPEEGAVTTAINGGMKRLEDTILQLEFGTYDGNYSVHLTPAHAQRNLRDDDHVAKAVNAAIVLLNQVVPYNLQVKIHMPRPDWKMKVISFVIEGGAHAWNFDIPKVEAECIPKIFEAVRGVILSE